MAPCPLPPKVFLGWLLVRYHLRCSLDGDLVKSYYVSVDCAEIQESHLSHSGDGGRTQEGSNVLT